jgi:endonuclease YncB( thermonuclease family)
MLTVSRLFSNCLRRICCCIFLCNSKKTDVPLDANTPPECSNLLGGELSYLNNASWKTCAPYVPNVTGGKVIKVYDGDTITIASRLNNSTDDTIYRFSVRLAGIDSAEIKSKTDFEKNLAICARDALHGKIIDKFVDLRNVSVEKYGRLLADVYCDGVFINDWMLQNNYAIPYDGGKKIPFI